MDYTLKQLSVFMTVAKLESTTAAARELSLSQSAVSSAIQQLESQIGQKLFDRIGRQLKLNRVGASLLPAVTELLAHAERLNLQLKGETIAGTVCIGASYTIANHIIVDTMVDFQKEHANVDIEINSDNSPGIIDSVIEGNGLSTISEGFPPSVHTISKRSFAILPEMSPLLIKSKISPN